MARYGNGAAAQTQTSSDTAKTHISRPTKTYARKPLVQLHTLEVTGAVLKLGMPTAKIAEDWGPEPSFMTEKVLVPMYKVVSHSGLFEFELSTIMMFKNPV